MKIVLNEAEIIRALTRYADAKIPIDPTTKDRTIVVHWRSQSATIEILPKVPTLTDKVTT